MKRKLPEALIWLGLILVGVLGLRTISNDDIWLYLALGRTIAAEGIQHVDSLTFSREGVNWVDPTWLYNLLAFRTWQLGGAPGIILAHLGALFGALLLLLPLARRWGGKTGTGAALLLVAWIIAPVLQPSPQVFCMIMPAAFIALLSKDHFKLRHGILLLALQLVWTQLHTSFLLGPFILLMFAVSAFARADSDPTRRRAMIFAVLVLSAGFITLINPYGFLLHHQALTSLSGVSLNFVRNWISPFSWQFDPLFTRHALTLSLGLGACGIMLHRGLLPAPLTACAVFSGIAAVIHPRLHHELFAVMAFPFLALSFQALTDFVRHKFSEHPTATADPNERVSMTATAVALAMVLSIGLVLSNQYYSSTGSASSVGMGVEYDMFPESAARVLESDAFPTRAVNLYSDGGYLAWRFPNRKTFVDQRVSLFGAGFFQQLGDALSGTEEQLSTFEEKWKPDAFIINCTLPRASRVVRGLMQNKHWALVYFDGTTALLARKAIAFESILYDKEIQKAGLNLLEQERLRFWSVTGGILKPPVSPRLVGAAQVFLDLEKYNEARTISLALARGTRGMSSAWIGLGFSELQLEEPERAIQALEHATRRFPKEIKGWLWLSEAYRRSERPLEAKQALGQASKINPGYTDQFLKTVEAKTGSGENP